MNCINLLFCPLYSLSFIIIIIIIIIVIIIIIIIIIIIFFMDKWDHNAMLEIVEV